MSTTQRNKVSAQEGRLLLAIQALKNDQISSIRAAAKLYDVPRSTLTHRVSGRTARVDIPQKNRKLSLTEEESLVQWILAMDERGQPPRVAAVREMANLLLASRGINPSPTVGECWVRNFVNRYEELKSKFSRKYDHQRALCEDPEVIRGWFKLVQNTIAKYGILEEDIYNFDETGFQMGVIGTVRVVTGSERARNPKLVQPGDREWVTVIAGVNAMGWALRTMIILKGKMHQSSWYETEGLPHDWVIGVSENGWTTDQLGLYWLKEVFNKETLPPEFDQFCSENQIIALYMPPHSSHLLQPLDVGCFSPLKTAYGRQVENQMRLGINHIDKEEFLALYPAAQMQALTENNIKSSFRAAGLVPYNPEQVLSRLNTTMHTPTPPGTSHSSQASWATATPHNIHQLEQQTKKVKGYIKHQRGRTYVAQEGALGVEEGLDRVRSINEWERGVVEAAESQPRRRAAPQCSDLKSILVVWQVGSGSLAYVARSLIDYVMQYVVIDTWR
ncbi:hypothetical protein HCAG_05839 [Histoplasma mississippiense (nom. inval.)]|uniref:hypothetical protein n=1 Tax=Ajellomyces capsulatus (strain NAm1 / WU24) TaxID=2059318 RepID=UPI000157CB7B|nr:hypothetical protein HCAG_05839 [Histoplasma mississippiense (nom. inval.)]EDN10036.1 hypothetical protein HCAG_05839 [Histoplasma mississippiense (nom. inval.)]